MSFDKSKIIVEAGDNPDFYKIRYKEGKKNSKIMFQIDHARIPFGIDEEYKQYYITIEINDNEYIEYIKNIEENICDVLCDELLDNAIILEPIKLQTQIRKSKYGHFIKTKIPQYKDKFNLTCTQNGYHKSILDIERGSFGTFVLYIDYLWIKENKIHYKWKIHRLEIE